jgi:Fic family protein
MVKIVVMAFHYKDLRITSEMLALISELDEFRGAWRALSTLSPERLAALRKVATIESIGSSTRIEGSRLSDTAVEALLGRLETHSFRSRDEEEVAGYAEAMDHIFMNYDDIPLTENHIKQIHGILLRYSKKEDHHRGRYKNHSNNVEAFDADGKSLGVVFQTASPFETPLRMQELVTSIQTILVESSLHPLLATAVFVVVFLAIHPFQDGNGRLSRILTTLLLLKAGYAYVPYSSLESVIEANKESYYLALRRTQMTLNQTQPDWEPWILFFLRSLQKQKRKLEGKLEQAKLMAAELPVLEVSILDLVRQHGRISMGEIIRATGQSRSTIKIHLGDMVRKGILVRHGKARSTWYTQGMTSMPSPRIG